MIRILWRQMRTHRDLRALNRQLRFEEVVEEYQRLPADQEDDLKSKLQYLHALNALKLLDTHTAPPEQTDSLGTPEQPLRVRYKTLQRSGFTYFLGLLKIAFEAGTLGLIAYIIFKEGKSPQELFKK